MLKNVQSNHYEAGLVDLSALVPNPHQPRIEMDERALEELTASIREHGLLQPLVARRHESSLELISGHRRLEAFRRLHAAASSEVEKTRFAQIPVHIRENVSNSEMPLLALVENLQRDDLSPVDAAAGLARFQELERLTKEELATRTGLDIDRVRRLLRLNSAPAVVKEACTKGMLVPVLDEGGAPALSPGGKERVERRQLDLYAALEFMKLHSHYRDEDPVRATDKTERLIQKALSESWGVRKIQEQCAAIMDGESEKPSGRRAERPAFRNDAKQLVLYKGRIASLDARTRQTLSNALKEVVAELEKSLPASASDAA
jgi:ParB/RepB/Spo0J family partition protein